jgi:hypothetical protein
MTANWVHQVLSVVSNHRIFKSLALADSRNLKILQLSDFQDVLKTFEFMKRVSHLKVLSVIFQWKSRWNPFSSKHGFEASSGQLNAFEFGQELFVRTDIFICRRWWFQPD